MLNIKRFLGMWVGVVVVSLACYGESAAQAGEATFVAVQLSPTDGVVFLEYTSTGQETVLGSLPQHISFADLDPTAEWLIPTRYHLSLASDGEQVAFVAEGDDESALFLFSLADNQLQQIPLALSAWSPEWSPDNEAILLRPRGYLVEDAYPEVYIYDIGTDTLSQITDTPDYWESLLLWHPSGDYVIFDSPCQEPCTYGIEDIYLTDRFGNIQVLTNLDSQLPDFVETYHNICFLAFNPYDQRIYYEIGCLRPGDGAQDLLFSTDLQGDNRLEIDLFEVYNDVFYSVRNIQGIEFLETGVILAVELWDIVPLHWSVAQLSAPGVLEPVLAVEFSNVYADQLLYGLNFSPDRNRFALRGFSPDDMYTLNVIEFDEGQLADLNDEQVVARHFEPEFFEICAVRWLDNQTVAFQVEQYGCGREVQSLNLLDVTTGEVTNLSQEVEGTLLFAPRTVGVKPPTADAGPDQMLTDNDDTGSELVTLDGSGSSDPDGTIESYVWTEDEVEIATGINPQVSLSVGVHTITLTVTDDDGATDTDEVVITVNAADIPTETPTATDTPTATPTDTPTPTPTATIPAPSGVLDDFNRSDGAVGSNWSGDTSGYSIVSNQLDVSSCPHNASGGYIGLWMVNASGTLLDDFDGGDVN